VRPSPQIRHASKLDARLRELAILQVAWDTRSAYEWSHHVKIGRNFGITDADLRAISGGNWQALQPDAQAVLAAAAGIVREGDLPDAQVEALRATFGEEVLTELMLICSIYVGLARFLHVARIEVEPDYMPELREFPLPPG
jgi:alkylhydroperoxidase family enzyme